MSKDKTQGDAVGTTDPEIVTLRTAKGLASFRAPTEAEYDRFTDLLSEPKGKNKAIKFLAVMTVVEPARSTFESWIAAKAGIPAAVSEAILNLAGINAEVEEKK